MPDFKEEECVNKLEEDEAVDDVVAHSDEATQLTTEVTNDVMAPSDEVAQFADKARQMAANRASEDAAQDLSPKP